MKIILIILGIIVMSAYFSFLINNWRDEKLMKWREKVDVNTAVRFYNGESKEIGIINSRDEASVMIEDLAGIQHYILIDEIYPV